MEYWLPATSGVLAVSSAGPPDRRRVILIGAERLGENVPYGVIVAEPTLAANICPFT